MYCSIPAFISRLSREFNNNQVRKKIAAIRVWILSQYDSSMLQNTTHLYLAAILHPPDPYLQPVWKQYYQQAAWQRNRTPTIRAEVSHQRFPGISSCITI